MSKRLHTWAVFGVPILIMTVSVVIMNLTPILLAWTGAGRYVPALLGQTTERAAEARWEDSALTLERAMSMWERVRPALSVNESRELLHDLDIALAELKGAVEAKDAAQTRITFHRTEALWKDLLE